jgi:hypothetical protein
MNWWSLLINIDTWICIVMVLMAIVILLKGQTPGSTQGTKVRFPVVPQISRSLGGTSKPETKCREIFQRLLKKPFPKVRPAWLVNPATKKRLELDGYCDSIKTKLGVGLAFEYDGRQHSQKVPYFHRKDGDFVNQVRRDFLKDRICKSRGIVLIRIPYTIKPQNLEEYIMSKLHTVL